MPCTTPPVSCLKVLRAARAPATASTAWRRRRPADPYDPEVRCPDLEVPVVAVMVMVLLFAT